MLLLVMLDTELLVLSEHMLAYQTAPRLQLPRPRFVMCVAMQGAPGSGVQTGRDTLTTHLSLPNAAASGLAQ